MYYSRNGASKCGALGGRLSRAYSESEPPLYTQTCKYHRSTKTVFNDILFLLLLF